MFVTCHLTFGQLSNFVGASLEVTRTIRNNKLHFTWGCSILLLKKGKGPWDRIPFFFQWFWHFLKYFNSNHTLPTYSLFSKCFSWFFFSLLLSRVTRPPARFVLASVWPKNAEKSRLFCKSRPPQWNNGFMVSSFLSFFISERMVKTNFFFYNDNNIQIRKFFSELVESKRYGKPCLIIIRIETNTAFLAFSLGM